MSNQISSCLCQRCLLSFYNSRARPRALRRAAPKLVSMRLCSRARAAGEPATSELGSVRLCSRAWRRVTGVERREAPASRGQQRRSPWGAWRLQSLQAPGKGRRFASSRSGDGPVAGARGRRGAGAAPSLWDGARWRRRRAGAYALATANPKGAVAKSIRSSERNRAASAPHNNRLRHEPQTPLPSSRGYPTSPRGSRRLL